MIAKQKFNPRELYFKQKRIAVIAGYPYIIIIRWLVYEKEYVPKYHYYIIPVNSLEEAYLYQRDFPDSEMRIKPVKRKSYQLRLFRKNFQAEENA